MSKQGGEKAVVISALVVLAVYAYRRATEAVDPSASKLKSIIGSGSPAPIGTFITAWGFTFFVLSLVASASPQFGGSFAILIAAGDALANTQSVVADINKKVSPTTASPAKQAQTAAAANLSNFNPNTSGDVVIPPTTPGAPTVFLQNGQEHG